jgi:hypothetical protein
LEAFEALGRKASEAQVYIQERKLKMEHQAMRALQLLTGDAAPSQWLRDNLSFDTQRQRIVNVPFVKGGAVSG